MKKASYLLLIAVTLFCVQETYSVYYTNTGSAVIDSSIFKYFPLNIGNRWTWHIHRNNSPGPGYQTAVILSSHVIRNHLYYRFRWDTYIFYGNQHSTGYSFQRIDSLTGNSYYLYSNNGDTIDCLSDSLNSSVGDSAYVRCIGPGQWYRHANGTYTIFNQTYQTKDFNWSNYFEAGGGRKFAENIGRVYEINQYLMSSEIATLRGCVINGVLKGDTTVYLGINQTGLEIPEKFSLAQNYPNPFNPLTNIKFNIPQPGFVKLSVFDILGREIQILASQQLSPGTCNIDFDASHLPSGVYCYRLEAGNFSETKKMVLIK